MSTDAATHLLLHGLVDDAALFPPAALPMPQAVSAYRTRRAGPYASLLGRFLCPASRLDELNAQLGPDERLALGLIMDTGVAGLPEAIARTVEDRRLELSLVEIPLPGGGDQAHAAHQVLHALHRLPQEVQAFVELPRLPGWRDALSLIAARRRGAKLRTGGLTSDAFPTEREVADFVKTCVSSGAKFKFTAGLHHAIRHTADTSGFEHHGFLNVLLAVAAAVRGGRIPTLVEILAERDPMEIVDGIRTVDTRTAAKVRQHFVGFGSCSFTEPVHDLTGLALLEKVADEPPPPVRPVPLVAGQARA